MCALIPSNAPENVRNVSQTDSSLGVDMRLVTDSSEINRVASHLQATNSISDLQLDSVSHSSSVSEFYDVPLYSSPSPASTPLDSPRSTITDGVNSRPASVEMFPVSIHARQPVSLESAYESFRDISSRWMTREGSWKLLGKRSDTLKNLDKFVADISKSLNFSELSSPRSILKNMTTLSRLYDAIRIQMATHADERTEAVAFLRQSVESMMLGLAKLSGTMGGSDAITVKQMAVDMVTQPLVAFTKERLDDRLMLTDVLRASVGLNFDQSQRLDRFDDHVRHLKLTHCRSKQNIQHVVDLSFESGFRFLQKMGLYSNYSKDSERHLMFKAFQEELMKSLSQKTKDALGQLARMSDDDHVDGKMVKTLLAAGKIPLKGIKQALRKMIESKMDTHGWTRKDVKNALRDMGKEYVGLLREREWTEVHTDIFTSDGVYHNTLVPLNEGVPSMDRTHNNMVNFWRSELRDESGDVVFSGYRHGVITGSFSKEENTIVDTRISELAERLVRDEMASGDEDSSGEELTITISSMNLETYLADEKIHILDQRDAFKRLESIQEVMINGRKVRVQFKVRSFDFGVNTASTVLKFGDVGFKQRNEEPFMQLMDSVNNYLAKNPDNDENYSRNQMIRLLKNDLIERFNRSDRSKDKFELPMRILALGHLIGDKILWNCKSGKDRTTIMDYKLKYFMVQLNRSIRDGGEIRLPASVGEGIEVHDRIDASQFAVGDGGAYVQRYCTGVVGNKASAGSDTMLGRLINGAEAFNMRHGESVTGLSHLVKS